MTGQKRRTGWFLILASASPEGKDETKNHINSSSDRLIYVVKEDKKGMVDHTQTFLSFLL
jgi:hypothetical protein